MVGAEALFQCLFLPSLANPHEVIIRCEEDEFGFGLSRSERQTD